MNCLLTLRFIQSVVPLRIDERRDLNKIETESQNGILSLLAKNSIPTVDVILLLLPPRRKTIQSESSSSSFRPRQCTSCLLLIETLSKHSRNSSVTNTLLIDQILFTFRSTFPSDLCQETVFHYSLFSLVIIHLSPIFFSPR